MLTKNITKTIMPIYEKIVISKFIRGVIKGDLEKKQFHAYLQQDILYLEEYAKNILRIAAKVDSPYKDKLLVHAQCTIGNQQFYQEYFSKQNIKGPLSMSKICRGYTQYISQSSRNNIIEGLVTAVPCLLFYKLLGEDFAKDVSINKNNPYFFWIKDIIDYSKTDTSFCDIARIIDNKAKNYPEKQGHLLQIAMQCARYEYLFFHEATQRSFPLHSLLFCKKKNAEKYSISNSINVKCL